MSRSALHRQFRLATWVIVAWFAVLQAMSPFIHGHLELDQPSKGAGLHMHVEDMGLDNQESIPTLKNATDPMHVVVVDKGIVKDNEPLFLPVLMVLMLLSVACLSPKVRPIFDYLFSPTPLLLRPSARPRAPPATE